jgi:hypothetical protein
MKKEQFNSKVFKNSNKRKEIKEGFKSYLKNREDLWLCIKKALQN